MSVLVTSWSHQAQAADLACSGASPGCTWACRHRPVRSWTRAALCDLHWTGNSKHQLQLPLYQAHS